ncbi:chymotrypsin family serine protease [Actinoplanes siamensis]|uniref:Streptogrisin C n=1 Tax=Actinoplanes siamensis TaxID=1223317 RepID=A0A919ND78_9ACTN|nr:hypothetical protein [Actinoplanes siamensis]GIF08981.1 hypothetical protein Asi03nite_65190 [Actinoplanes siamensis]
MSKAVLRTSMALGAALLSVGTLYPMSPALADNGGASPASLTSGAQADFDLKQSAMTDLKSWIITRPGIESSGYVESINDPANLSTTLLWHGPADALQASILAEAKRRGITAKVEQRKYSMKDIKTASKRALESSGKGAFKDVTIYSVSGLTADFDGIKVNVQQATNASGIRVQSKALSTTAGKAANDQIAKNAAAELGIAVEVDPGTPITPTATARGTDTPAYNAGGYMTDSSGHVCSTGFSIRGSAQTYSTTARHCQSTYGPRELGGTRYGATYKYSTDGAARVLTSQGSALMFYGPWDSTSRATVKSFGDVSLGDLVCTNGGNSGTHCGGNSSQKVTDMVHTWNDGYGSVSTIEAKRIDGAIAVIQGDSGGPIYQNITGTTVKAVGMIQAAGAALSNCGDVRDGGGNVCSATVYFTGMRTIVRGVSGTSLVTG